MNQTLLIVLSTIIAIFMGSVMTFYRVKASKRPATIKRMIIPPLMMGTGSLMFLFPVFHISLQQTIQAIMVGVLCSLFLIRTSRFKIEHEKIYLIPSKAFIYILIGLFILRTIFKIMIGQTIPFGETSGIFYILALSMITTWRLTMLFQFIKLSREIKIKNYS